MPVSTDRTLLVVDDEINILHSLKRALRREPYRVLTAASAAEGLEILQREPVGVVISDQRMPGMSGIEFLARVKELYPATIRIILSGYTDVSSITEAINIGSVYKFILKPWEDETLKATIRECLEMYRLQRENHVLTEIIKEQNQELRDLNRHLEREVEKRTAEIKLQNEALKLARDILESLPVAVMGTDNDLTVVLVNSLARDHFEPENQVLLGSGLNNYFGQDLVEMVTRAVSGGKGQEALYRHTDGGDFKVCCVPLVRADPGTACKGAVISFLKVPRE